MPRPAAKKPVRGAGKSRDPKGADGRGLAVARHGRFIETKRLATVRGARFEAIMKAAAWSGLLGEKRGRISGRISPVLIARAKRQTGIRADTDLIEFALANVALEDRFAEAFKRSRGKVDPALKLGF